MVTPLDPVIAQIIPLLPLRDPTTMTPQSARDALRALAASRAAVPPPAVTSAEDIKVKGAAGFLNARAYRNSSEKSPTVVFFHGGGWVAGDLDTHDRQARWLAIETGAVVVSVDYRRPPEVRFPGAFEDALRRQRTSSPASPNSAATRARRRGRRQRRRQSRSRHRDRLPRRRHQTGGAIAGLSRHRRRSEISPMQKRTRAFPRAPKTRKAIF